MPAPKSGSKASSASKPASAPPPPKSGSAASSAYKPAESKYWSAPPSSASKSESAASSAQASHQLCSAAKPANDHCVVAFYNITWDNGRLTGKNREKHEQSLAEDLDVALKSYKADVVLLSECGEIKEGLIEKLWLPLVCNIAGPGFAVKHQSHYTSIVRLNTVHIREGPMPMGPMATWQGLHEDRKCQFLSIELKDSADKPITDKPIRYMYFAYHVIWYDSAFKHTCGGLCSSGKAMLWRAKKRYASHCLSISACLSPSASPDTPSSPDTLAAPDPASNVVMK